MRDIQSLDYVLWLPEVGSQLLRRVKEVDAIRGRVDELRLEIAALERDEDRAYIAIVTQVEQDWTDEEVAAARRTARRNA
jgi:hypothetical protein